MFCGGFGITASRDQFPDGGELAEDIDHYYVTVLTDPNYIFSFVNIINGLLIFGIIGNVVITFNSAAVVVVFSSNMLLSVNSRGGGCPTFVMYLMVLEEQLKLLQNIPGLISV